MDEQQPVVHKGQPESADNGGSVDSATAGMEGNPASGGTSSSQAEPQSGMPPATAPEMTKSEPAKVVSDKKLAANRANAQHSTGAKTPEGKQRSAQNSRKHGFFARQPLPAGQKGDDLWAAYRDLAAGIWEHFEPMNYLEGLLTEKVITESIRLSRLLEYESQYIGQVGAFHSQGVDRILRFQGSINRQLFQAMKESLTVSALSNLF